MYQGPRFLEPECIMQWASAKKSTAACCIDNITRQMQLILLATDTAAAAADRPSQNLYKMHNKTVLSTAVKWK